MFDPSMDDEKLSSSHRREPGDIYYTQAPRPRTPFEESYSDRKHHRFCRVTAHGQKIAVLKRRQRLSCKNNL